MSTDSKKRLRVYEQGAATYVIGTNDTQEALDALGISPETHQWGSTLFGRFVRRQSLWRSASEVIPQKDAVPGVAFIGRIRPTEATR